MEFEFRVHQIVFMLFFAIFWGAVANVQPRWKAFQFPLMFRRELRNVFLRVVLAILLLNLLPIVYFGYILWATHGRGPMSADSTFLSITKTLIQGILPAFGIFGLYRAWLGIVELRPSWFYKSKPDDVPVKYRHVEPTYRLDYQEKREPSEPVVDLGTDAGKGNLFAAMIYLIVGCISPWIL
jgi:hypothetical protein